MYISCCPCKMCWIRLLFPHWVVLAPLLKITNSLSLNQTLWLWSLLTTWYSYPSGGHSTLPISVFLINLRYKFSIQTSRLPCSRQFHYETLLFLAPKYTAHFFFSWFSSLPFSIFHDFFLTLHTISFTSWFLCWLPNLDSNYSQYMYSELQILIFGCPELTAKLT